MIHVGLLPSDVGACGFYRLLYPFWELEKAGQVRVIFRPIEGGSFDFLDEDWERSDVVVLQKLTGYYSDGAKTDILRRTIAHGRCIYELDDDLFRLTAENPCLEKSSHAAMSSSRQIMASCAMITTTTPYAAAAFQPINKHVRVVPNGINLDLWPVPTRHDPSRVRVGWITSPHHVEDARLLVKPWRTIARRYPQARFVLAGHLYECLRDAVGADRLEYHPPVTMDAYPAFVAGLGIDISVAPLVDSRFARSKSPLKLLDSSAVGAAFLGSDVAPYRWALGENAWALCRRGEDWISRLSLLVEDSERRAALAVEQRAIVESRFLVRHTAAAWLSAIEEVIAR